jgi:hypothetical protein
MGRFLDAVLDPGLRGHHHSKRNISLKHRLAWAGIAVLFLAIPIAAQSDWSACQQPPWSQLWAISVNAGDVAWSVSFGTIPELAAKGVHNGGSLNYGGDRSLPAAAWSSLRHRTINISALRIRHWQNSVGHQAGGGFFDRTGGEPILAFALPSTSIVTGEPSTSRIAHMEDL